MVEFKYNKKKELRGKILNGSEKILLKNITYKDEELSIPLGTYELSLELNQQNASAVKGYLVRHNKNPPTKTPVTGILGPQQRFLDKIVKPSINLTGKWAVEILDEDDVKSSGVVTFKQTGESISGSILTPTGDYRYMEGFVSDNFFMLASFDGVYNYIFKGKLKDGKLEAKILSSTETRVSGTFDPKAQLPDAYKQTELKQLKFIFPDAKGQSVSLNHPKFKNKPVIVQIYGSWCPNCLDEMNFLIPWYHQNHKRGVEIVALAFERSLGLEEANRQLLKVQTQKKVPYPILLAGVTADDKPMSKIEGLKNFISFPTTIFLNKKHEVVKVHAGFSGPSTGEYFEKWKKEFNQTVNGLLR
jgi:thiol-disulfide isomerase/thioredoxin